MFQLVHSYLVELTLLNCFADAEKNSNKSINTYTIGYENNNYDESSYAKLVAKHLGTSHTELILSPKDYLMLFQKYPRYMTNHLLTRHKCQHF